MKRLRYNQILKDLKKKMVIITGPRQVGKTWLAKKVMESYSNPLYLNFDDLKDREIIKNRDWSLKTDLIIFDELHKMEDWKTYIKGVFDNRPENLHILLTGSARLHTFKKTGESLAGRFYLHRLMPFSPKELEINDIEDGTDDLIEKGGFPEPFTAENISDSKRWRRLYIDGLIREDILAFDNIAFLKKIDTLIEMLRYRVASPISFRSIAEDLKISPTTVSKYINILESLFIIFTIRPYSKNIARSIIKEPKVYFYDTGMIKGDIGAKVENLAAISLLKYSFLKQDLEGEDIRINYLRTKSGHEVDFCIVHDNKIKKIIEVKNRKTNISKSLIYFSEKYQLDAAMIIKELKKPRVVENIQLLNLNSFLKDL